MKHFRDVEGICPCYARVYVQHIISHKMADMSMSEPDFQMVCGQLFHVHKGMRARNLGQSEKRPWEKITHCESIKSVLPMNTINDPGQSWD